MFFYHPIFMMKRRSPNKSFPLKAQHSIWKIHNRAINSIVISGIFLFLVSHIQILKAHPTKSELNHKIQYVEVDRISLSNPKKHCVNKIEIKSEHLFMRDGWQSSAENETKAKWAESVKKRYGSVYSQWETAENKKYECRRIGFGNDPEGNVGTSVLCLIEAEPCVNLLKK